MKQIGKRNIFIVLNSVFMYSGDLLCVCVMYQIAIYVKILPIIGALLEIAHLLALCIITEETVLPV